jgi:hypothetical protein
MRNASLLWHGRIEQAIREHQEHLSISGSQGCMEVQMDRSHHILSIVHYLAPYVASAGYILK